MYLYYATYCIIGDKDMPTLSIYVTDQIYKCLLDKGSPSKVGKSWLEDRYAEEVKND